MKTYVRSCNKKVYKYYTNAFIEKTLKSKCMTGQQRGKYKEMREAFINKNVDVARVNIFMLYMKIYKCYTNAFPKANSQNQVYDLTTKEKVYKEMRETFINM